jgi:hypothetical protein
MLIDSDVSEWPREKVVSRHHTFKMSDDDLKHLHVNAGATLHVREVQLGNEAQISKTMLFFLLYHHRRGQRIDSRRSPAAKVIVTCVEHRIERVVSHTVCDVACPSMLKSLHYMLSSPGKHFTFRIPEFGQTSVRRRGKQEARTRYL